MQRIVLLLALAFCGVAQADTFVIRERSVTITSAQQQAEKNARTGTLTHCSVLNGRREGIGFSTLSAQNACENACYYQDAMRGRYRIVERGVARGPRGWYAVLRYE
jgi:hypothetical protein